MAKLVIVHEHDTNREILLNCDQIESAAIGVTKSETYTSVKMVNGQSHTLTESLYDLLGRSQSRS